jgi:hypothetical protein
MGHPSSWQGKFLNLVLTHTLKTLAVPALKRMIKVETLSRSAQALLPPHKCGGSHHESHGFLVRTHTLQPVHSKQNLCGFGG